MDPGEEDDDFGDFGGFEAADPVLPNVAQVQASGIEASPSPWAVFAAGSNSGNVKPDLLCGQNRFPPVLDPSVPSSSSDVLQNGDTNNSSIDIPTGNNDGTSGNQNENFDDATLANDILDGSFKSTSSQHSSSGATAADLIRSANTMSNNGTHTARKDSQSVDLVGDLFGASPGIVLVEDENLPNDALNSGQSNSVLIQDKNRSVEHIPVSSVSRENLAPLRKTETEPNSTLYLPPSPGGSSQSSESHHSPMLIDSLRKALQQKPPVDIIKQSQKQVECSQHKKEQKVNQIDIDPVITEEIKQARLEGQAAIATVVDQYKELSKQCISQQEDVLRECKQILKQEQEVLLKQLLQQQKEEFSKALEEEKVKLKEESEKIVQNLVAEQKKEFDSQMELEKEKYESRLQQALEEEKESCRKKVDETLEIERLQMNKKVEEEKEKFREDLQEERKKYLEEMKCALSEEKEKNKESVKEMLTQERDHCQKCVKAFMKSFKEEMQSYIDQQKQKDKVVRHRQLSSLDVFLETAKQQLNVLMEDNQKDLDGSKLDNEKKDET